MNLEQYDKASELVKKIELCEKRSEICRKVANSGDMEIGSKLYMEYALVPKEIQPIVADVICGFYDREKERAAKELQKI